MTYAMMESQILSQQISCTYQMICYVPLNLPLPFQIVMINKIIPTKIQDTKFQ